MPGQTVQTRSREEQSDQGLHCLHSVCIVYSMVEPHSSNFRVITTILGVRIFRKFTVPFIVTIEPRHDKTCLREFATR